MRPFIRLLLLHGLLNSVFGNYDEGNFISEMMNHSDIFLGNNDSQKQKFLVPYVRNVYRNVDRLDTITGNISFLIPNEDITADDSSLHNIVFDTSGILQNSITRLVISTDEPKPGELVRISHQNVEIRTMYTPFGFVSDITRCTRENSKTEMFMVDLSELSRKPFRIKTIMAVFKSFTQSEVSMLESVIEESGRQKRSRSDILPEIEAGIFNTANCGVKPWNVTFREIGLSFIVIPSSYAANICEGLCPAIINHPYYNSTNYSMVKNYYHLNRNSDETVPRACCVPAELSPLKILYMDRNHSTQVKLVPNMTIKTCSCL